MSAFTDDLNFALATRRAVRVRLYSGDEYGLVGVREVNEEGGFVTLHTPSHMQDETTTTKVLLDAIASVEVTDVEY